ncbi:hypothetical protein EJ063_07180 [Vibrio aquaticus]|uniref:Uncharacterized protein n=1 Tax=Vibrio aquaticus TaxID=2496559 RepID=A0A432CZP6_9VIBR|nr:hypothetical protein [Vibrio aquaticus]RTZ16574.1 hypothetical protein EJ063_07180 [Vibrio aquaticus]
MYLIGLGATIFLIQALLVGVTAPAMLSAALITTLTFIVFLKTRKSTSHLYQQSLQSLALRLLPKLRQQVVTSSEFSYQAVIQLSTKVESMRNIASHIKQVDADPCNEIQQYRDQMEQLYKDILVVLQFGDRLHQQQEGLKEGLSMVEEALNDIEQLGWDEVTLLEELELIEQTTKVEPGRSPEDEGSVTFF